MKKYLISNTGKFYKANLHCHSTVSDGTLTPQELKRVYKAHGYSILAYTDHGVMLSHADLNDSSFLTLMGYEMEVNEKGEELGKGDKCCHMTLIALNESVRQVCYHRTKYLYKNAKNYRHLVRFDPSLSDFEREYTPECISRMMRAAREGGFFVTYNHPTLSLESWNEYMRYDGMSAMEILNYSSLQSGFDEYNPRVYDDMLRQGKRIFCIAADDNHNKIPLGKLGSDSFGAFTMIKADSLEYEAVTSALARGDFYSSEGPIIDRLWDEDGEIHINCRPCDRIIFTTARRTSKIQFCGVSGLLTHASFRYSSEDIYVRVSVIDKSGKRALTNAYFI